MPRKINYLRNQQARVSVITSGLPCQAMLNYIHQSKEMAHGPKQSFSALISALQGPGDHHGRETNINSTQNLASKGCKEIKGSATYPLPSGEIPVN